MSKWASFSLSSKRIFFFLPKRQLGSNHMSLKLFEAASAQNSKQDRGAICPITLSECLEHQFFFFRPCFPQYHIIDVWNPPGMGLN